MVFRGKLWAQAEIAWALLPRRVLPGSAAASGWRRFRQFRRICRDIEVAVVAGRGAQRRVATVCGGVGQLASHPQVMRRGPP